MQRASHVLISCGVFGKKETLLANFIRTESFTRSMMTRDLYKCLPDQHTDANRSFGQKKCFHLQCIMMTAAIYAFRQHACTDFFPGWIQQSAAAKVFQGGRLG